MAPVLSKLTARGCTLSCASASLLFWIVWQMRKKNIRNRKKAVEKVHYIIGEKSSSKEKAQVDKVFFKRLWTILKILIPGWFSPESGLLVMVAALLVIRTYCDMWIIKNGTLIESAIIGRDWSLFKQHLMEFMALAPSMACVTSFMKFGLSELALRFRTRLSSHLYKQYMEDYTYYKMNNLDTRIANPDQLLTQDVERFCTSLTELYSNIMKPVADIIVFLHRLTTSIGFVGPSVLISYLILAGYALNIIRKPIVRMTVMEQKLEGEFRYINSRLITNSEEVAFYQGNKREKVTLDLAFRKLINHLRKFVHFKFSMGFLDTMIAKYLGMVVGYTMISHPFFSKSSKIYSSSHVSRQENYYTSGKLLLKLAESITRLVLAGREMTRLAGFTSRVFELINVLEDLQKGTYVRTMLNDDRNAVNGDIKDSTIAKANQLKPGDGKIVYKNNMIQFKNIPLMTPNGDVLVQELNFEVRSGMNVLVCGPNGCGKSSLFRILGELWPLFGGILTKPNKSKLFYIPQRPYMTLGTLRDQIIYPDTTDDQKFKKADDKELLKYLDLVQLTYILDREGGLDAVQDWMDVLSGGEKQRIAMARLFYHKPQFAILDECTSAVSVDVEDSMYQYCRQVGITLFTVSHRKSLWKHHEYFLHMDGRGSFDFKKIDSDTLEFGS